MAPTVSTDLADSISSAPHVMTLQEAARALTLGRTKFFEVLATGELPTRYIGRRRVVHPDDLRAYIDRLPAAPPRCSQPCCLSHPLAGATAQDRT
ncbi:MAG: helix-turn-helix domain-containing protein [Dietzia sp.]